MNKALAGVAEKLRPPGMSELCLLFIASRRLRCLLAQGPAGGDHSRQHKPLNSCNYNPLFAYAMLKRAVAGINVSLAVRVRMAALSMSGWFRRAG